MRSFERPDKVKSRIGFKGVARRIAGVVKNAAVPGFDDVEIAFVNRITRQAMAGDARGRFLEGTLDVRVGQQRVLVMGVCELVLDADELVVLEDRLLIGESLTHRRVDLL